ncbi:MAG: DNA methyltransferase, partial [candidate division Zixibacteria bacterium]|nr:DNA methyltransferase [candidate division Zixibacteria bacterium]
NPPYSGHSLNKGPWISRLIETYKEGCPELRKPAQAKWLSDDYVKFIRFAQWRIEQTGYGILGFITNHSYLDSPTFRGMRQSLKKTFDDIYVLDLHGNTKRKEVCPDGSKDENVFDIQQGVAISIFLKHKRDAASSDDVFHSDLWGTRGSWPKHDGSDATNGKHAWLAQNDVKTEKWSVLRPAHPDFFLVPRDTSREVEYTKGWQVSDIFNPNGDPAPGIVTTHDQFAVSWTAEEAVEKVERLLSTTSEDEARQLFRLCSQNQWNYGRAKRELTNGDWRQSVTDIHYRPFDIRWTVYDRNVAVHRRDRVMRHFRAGENLALITSRMTKGESFRHTQVTRIICEVICMSPRTSNNGFIFPLYLYPNGDLFDNGETSDAPGGRRPNLNQDFVKDVAKKVKLKFVPDGVGDLKKTFGPEDIFHYMYAVFHSPTYRSRYAEFLKIDFPRLPLTTKRPLFRTLCGLGAELVGLHLMEQHGPPLARFEQEGDMLVEQVRFTDEIAASSAERRTPRNDDQPQAACAAGKVWINQTQYFDCVPREVWEFHIGGYQVCHKWLKDRKGRTLSIDDIDHYQHIVSALSETIRLMAEIDAAIDQHGGWPIQ